MALSTLPSRARRGSLAPLRGLLAQRVHLRGDLRPKSSDSQKGRISRSLGPGIGFGHRFAHSTASSIERTCQTQNPATSSLVSAKGPWSPTVHSGAPSVTDQRGAARLIT